MYKCYHTIIVIKIDCELIYKIKKNILSLCTFSKIRLTNKSITRNSKRKILILVKDSYMKDCNQLFTISGSSYFSHLKRSTPKNTITNCHKLGVTRELASKPYFPMFMGSLVSGQWMHVGLIFAVVQVAYPSI